MITTTSIHETIKSDKRYDAKGVLHAFVWALFMLFSVPLPVLAATGLSSKPVSVTNSLWRISVKVLKDPNGRYPSWSEWPEVLDKFVDALDDGNEVLTFTGRNVRLDLVEIIDLERPGLHLPSLDLDNAECGTIAKELGEATKNDPLTYAYRKDAINVYYVDCAGIHNGVANLPKQGDIVVLRPSFGRATLIHELGHHFGLLHTHTGIKAEVAKNCDTYYPEGFLRVYLEPGDDGLSDTVADHPCWWVNDMANNTAGVDYEDLMPGDDRIINTYANVMSYHAPVEEIPETKKRRLTNEQLDLMLFEAATSRVREVAQEMQRVTGVSAYLSDSDRRTGRDQLVDEFLGSWVAVDGDDSWVSSLDINENPHVPGQLIGALDSSITNGWTNHVYFRPPSIYTDALTATPEPSLATNLNYNGPYTDLTYTVRMTYDNKLDVRVAAYENGATYPFSEHRVILERGPETIRATFQSRPKLP